MAFPPQFLDELRARISVSEVIAPKVRLNRRGRESTGLCPFHNEKTPSFTANDDKGFYHCFGCGAHGDIISFTMETEGLNFPEAVEKLAGMAGLPVPRQSPEERERAKDRATLQQVMEQACAWFENQLAQPGGRQALDYLRGRGFSDETIERFRLGYAPDGRGRLGQALETRNVTRAQLVEGGLVKLPDGGGEPRDYFFNRVIFPITDRRSQVIAFGGRILGAHPPAPPRRCLRLGSAGHPTQPGRPSGTRTESQRAAGRLPTGARASPSGRVAGRSRQLPSTDPTLRPEHCRPHR